MTQAYARKGLQLPYLNGFGLLGLAATEKIQPVDGILRRVVQTRLAVFHQPAHHLSLVLLQVLVAAKFRAGLDPPPAGNFLMTDQAKHR